MGMTAVLKFKMSNEMLRRKIAKIAADSSRVVITQHAKQRMRQRKVLLRQVLDVLHGGKIVEPAHQNTHGDWCCTLEKLTAGDRVKVPAVLESKDSGEFVIVITVIN